MECQARNRPDRPGRGEHREIVPIHVIEQRPLPDGVESVEREIHPLTIRPYEPMEPDR